MPKKTGVKKTTFGADLIEGMQLVAAHQRGEIELEQVWPKPIDVKAIRRRVKMSQAEFARAYGLSKRALQEWEQGGRQPDRVPLGGRLGDTSDELEELRGPDDRVGDAGRLDQVLLGHLGTKVAAIRCPVGTDHRKRDVMSDAG